MTWTLKVAFRPNPEKEITKEIRIEPKAFLFKALVDASNIFGINDPQSYSFVHRKQVLPLLSNAEETGLAQGSSISLIKSSKKQTSSTVCFNYKIILEDSIHKIIQSHLSVSNFLNCLQNVGPNRLNVLRHEKKLAEVSILSGKLSANDLIILDNFSLDSLGMRGNYLVTVSFVDSSIPNDFFIKFLDSRGNLSILESKNISESLEKNQLKPEIVTTCAHLPSAENDIDCVAQAISGNMNDYEFRIIYPVVDASPAPDMPDSFYELTREDLISYQKSIQKKASNRSSIDPKNFKTGVAISSKNETSVPVKLTFPDKMQIHTSFSINTTAQSIVDFIRLKIMNEHESEIELWTGSPCKPIKGLGKSLASLGIDGPTKIFVKCNKFNYKEGLIQNK